MKLLDTDNCKRIIFVLTKIHFNKHIKTVREYVLIEFVTIALTTIILRQLLQRPVRLGGLKQSSPKSYSGVARRGRGYGRFSNWREIRSSVDVLRTSAIYRPQQLSSRSLEKINSCTNRTCMNYIYVVTFNLCTIITFTIHITLP